MIEVTDEMRRVGGETLRKCREMEVFHEQAADAAYRAMRALEPVPPELRNRQAPASLKTGDPGMRPEDQARGMPYQWALSPDEYLIEKNEKMTRRNAGPLNPREGANGRMFNDPTMAEMDRRIAALERAIARSLSPTAPPEL